MSQIINEKMVVGLSWSVLSSQADQATNLKKRIRVKGNLVSANKYIINTVGENTYIGFYNESPLEQNKKSRLYSLSMSFLAQFDGQPIDTVNSILLMNYHDRKVLVIIEGGLITYENIVKDGDHVGIIDASINSGLVFSIYGDSNYPNIESLNWEDFTLDKRNQLLSLPANLVLMGSLFGIGCLVGAGIFYYQNIILPEKKRAELLLQNAQQNHTPQYLAQLARELQKVGATSKSLEALTDSFRSENYFHLGWALTQINCDVDAKSCEYRYERQGGEVEKLITAMPDKKIDTITSTRDLAIFRKPFDFEIKSISKNELQPLVGTTNSLRTFLQKTTNAGATAGSTPTVAWPTQGIEMAKVDKNTVVQQTGVEIRFPYILSHSLIDLIPHHVGIKQVSIVAASTGDKAASLILTFKGASYATQ